MNRRTAIKGTMSSVGLSSVAWPAALKASRLPLDNLHEFAADAAKVLRSGRDVSLRLLMPIGCEDNVMPVAQEFQSRTGIQLLIDWVEVDRINESLMIDHMVNGERYDLALPASFGIPDLAESGIILNLEPFVERYEPPQLRDKQLYQVADYFNGKPFGFQTDGDVYVMFYNRPWLEDLNNQKRFADRYGYPLKIAQTWNELDAQMAFFHNPNEGQYGGTLFRNPDYLIWEWWLRFHAKGGYPLTDEAYPIIDSQIGVDALLELISATRFQHPECKTAGLFRNWELYSEGSAFANIGWGGTQKYLNSEFSTMRGNLAFGPTPGEMIEGKLHKVSYFNWGWEFTVISSANEPEIAYLFALFASSPEMSMRAIRGRSGFFDPFRAEHYEDETIRDIYGDAFLQVHRESMSKAMPDFYIPGHSDYMAALKSNILHAFEAIISPQEALDNAAKQWRLITIENGIETQRAHWQRLKEYYRN